MTVLDASAVVTLIHNKPGGDVVAEEIAGTVLGAADLAELKSSGSWSTLILTSPACASYSVFQGLGAGFGSPRLWIATGCSGIYDSVAGLRRCFLRAASFFSTEAKEPDYQGVRGVSRVVMIVGAGRPCVTNDIEG